MSGRTTKLLILLVALSLACAIIGGVRLRDARRSAIDRADDLKLARAALGDLDRRGGGLTAASFTSGDSALNRRLRAAAIAAGVGEQLTSIEPGQPVRLRDGEFVETPVFLRLDAATLRGTVGMLARLCADDASMTVKSIELSPPGPAASPTAVETWTADLTVAYLVYSPRR